jgi:hypothetical protein
VPAGWTHSTRAWTGWSATGRYARWFDAHYGQALTRAAMPGRRVLPLPDYELMPGASLADFDVLRRAPGRP